MLSKLVSGLVSRRIVLRRPTHSPAFPAHSLTSDDFNLRLQLDSTPLAHALLHLFDQFQDIVRRGLAIVDNEIAVFRRHDRAAYAQALQAEFIHDTTCGHRLRIFENAAGARCGGLRRPALFAEGVHALADFFLWRMGAAEYGLQRNVVLEQRARTILDWHIPRGQF